MSFANPSKTERWAVGPNSDAAVLWGERKEEEEAGSPGCRLFGGKTLTWVER